MSKSFGILIQKLRKGKKWTVKEFIEKLEVKVSPTYITKIEVYGEIPKPELICKMAEVFNYNEQKLLNEAKENKVYRFQEALSEKYKKAVGMYRLQKGNKK